MSIRRLTGPALGVLLAAMLIVRAAQAEPEDSGAAREWAQTVQLFDQQLHAVNDADRELTAFSTKNKLTPKGKTHVKALATKLDATRQQLQSSFDAAQLMGKRPNATLDEAIKFRRANEALLAEAADVISKERAAEQDASLVDRSAEEAAAKREAAEKARAAQEAQRREAEERRKADAEKARAAQEAQRREAEERRKADAEQKRAAQEAQRREAEERRKTEAEQKRTAEEERKKSEADARRRAEEARVAAAEAASAKAAAAEQEARNEVNARIAVLERATQEQAERAREGAQMLSSFLARLNLTIDARGTAMKLQKSLESTPSLDKRIASLRAMPASQARQSLSAVQADVERHGRELTSTVDAARTLVGNPKSYLTGGAPGPAPALPVAKAADASVPRAPAASASAASKYRTEDVVPMCEFAFEAAEGARGVSLAIDGGAARALPTRVRLASGRHTLLVKKDKLTEERNELLLCGHIAIIPIDAPK